MPGAPQAAREQPLLVLREGLSKSECARAAMLWSGYQVSEDVFLLCLCCLLLAEETAIFGPYLSLGGSSDAPLRILFLLCVLLLSLWIFLLLCLLAFFPQFPTQLLGGALGCLSWRLLYQGWYRLGPSWFCPGRPGLGLLNTPESARRSGGRPGAPGPSVTGGAGPTPQVRASVLNPDLRPGALRPGHFGSSGRSG